MLPDGVFLKPVENHDELIAFQFPFQLEGKAVDDGQYNVITENEDGDLIIEGYAAVFDGVDRMNENFAEGAFSQGVKAFMANPSHPLCFHHKHDHVIGSVMELREEAGHGLWMRARVDKQPESSPLRWIYDSIRKGSMRSLSVGGYFDRDLGKRRIVGVDMTEVSVTGVPIHSAPSFSIVGGKALEDLNPDDTAPGPYDEALTSLESAIRNLHERLPEGKASRGRTLDLHFLSHLIALEQSTNNFTTENELLGPDGKGDDRVDALARRVKNYLDGVSREAHGLASDLGPLPQVPTSL